jgi:polyhydroxybutyrate depolymerase
MLRLAILSLLTPLLLPLLVPVLILRAVEADSTPIVTDLNQLLEPGRHRVSIHVDDRDRHFIFITPKGFKPGAPLPIVFFFHGAGGTAQQAWRTYGWTQKADAENFFVAFPEGLPVRPDGAGSFLLNPNIWRDGRPGMLMRGIDDIHFFEEMLNRLEATLPIDPKRVYVTGFSNGAGMTFTLGACFADRIAAIAPVSSQSFIAINKLARPVPVYYLAGTADPLVPYHGGTVTLPWGNTRTTAPVEHSAEVWAALDGCPPTPEVVSDEHGVRVVRYGPGKEDAEVLFTTIDGNGHHWPDTVELLPHAICGPTLDPFSATDRIWDFFTKHPMP